MIFREFTGDHPAPFPAQGWVDRVRTRGAIVDIYRLSVRIEGRLFAARTAVLAPLAGVVAVEVVWDGLHADLVSQIVHSLLYADLLEF